MGNNGSVSYLDPAEGIVTSNIFEKANSRPLGDIVQSFTVVGQTGYIVVNGSSKIEIVDLGSFKTISEPLHTSYPRYLMPVTEKKAYLSNGSMQGYVFLVDLEKHVITDSVEVGFGPEAMVKLGTNAYICNSGGWLLDSTLSVIDINTDRLLDTLTTGKVPVDILADSDNNLWVYCRGYAMYEPEPPYNLISETDALIQKIDPATGTILWQGEVGKAGDYSGIIPRFALSSDGLEIYYLRPDGIYSISTLDPAVSQTPVIPGNFYGIDTDPDNGDLYLFEASLSGNGTLKIADKNLNLLLTYTVGIMPNSAVFVP